jgi:hypothetical protein
MLATILPPFYPISLAQVYWIDSALSPVFISYCHPLTTFATNHQSLEKARPFTGRRFSVYYVVCDRILP